MPSTAQSVEQGEILSSRRRLNFNGLALRGDDAEREGIVDHEAMQAILRHITPTENCTHGI
ncbi:hypothetical protein NW757_005964 [Fusarium falciforme]|nr:hypothetical protein NW757_005964 [Fusarium falciforme]